MIGGRNARATGFTWGLFNLLVFERPIDGGGNPFFNL